MKISDHLVQLLNQDEYDRSPLQRESFLVNMRLYRISPSYRRCILEIVRYMDEHLQSHFDDYQDPRGIAAPNLGFPMRIIGYRKQAGENQFCLNPKITYSSPQVVKVNTNCGSLCLKELVEVERHDVIDFEYYDLEAKLVRQHAVGRNMGGFTIQHEINQINGKTLIDYMKNKPKVHV